MKLLVCGGRTFTAQRTLNKKLDELAPDCILEGGASGADYFGRRYATDRGLPLMEMPANWSFYGKSAGPIRNRWMLEFGMPDLVLACPGGPGTNNMKELARKAGLEVIELLDG